VASLGADLVVKAAAEANMAEVRRSFMVSLVALLWLRLRHRQSELTFHVEEQTASDAPALAAWLHCRLLRPASYQWQ